MMSGVFLSYLRVSTDRQGKSGLGIEAQREAVTRYVGSVGGELRDEYIEIETGQSCTRPILVKVIARCRRERATLIIARLDRLARSVSFVSSLMESKIEFVAADNPAANKPMLQMLAVFAEYERDQIAERTRVALAAARARGVKLGANGAVLAQTRKLDALRFADGLRQPVATALAGGSRTLADIAYYLNASGLRTREGASWSAQSAYKLLRRLQLSTSGMQAEVPATL